MTIPGLTIDHVVINAGVLKYPNRATELYDKSCRHNVLLSLIFSLFQFF
jgi:hypothetical protein